MATAAEVGVSKTQLPAFMTSKMFAINMFLLAAWILSIPFVYHAITSGGGFVLTGESAHPVLNLEREGHYAIAIYAIAAHMVAGGMMNFLVPLQVHLGLTRKSRSWHKIIGLSCLVIAFTGAFVGTVFFVLYPESEAGRGPWSHSAGAMYGVAMFYVTFKCVQTIATRDFKTHKEWAVRLFALAIGSYLSRVIGGWQGLFMVTELITRETNVYFTMFRNWGFWVAPLLMIQFYYVMQRRNKFANLPAYTPFVVSLAGVIFLAVGTGVYLMAMFSRMS